MVEHVKTILPSNADITLLVNRADYVRGVLGNRYDVVLVDGMGSNYTRLECCIHSLASLRPGGIIVMDNSDWLPLSCSYLRNAGMLQIDFSGFLPGTDGPQRTSVFFAQPSAMQHKPHLPAVAGVVQDWEDPNQDPKMLELIMRRAKDEASA